MHNSNQPADAVKPAQFTKPFGDFPLSYHPPSGRLYRKIKGVRRYFGYGRDWEAALARYNKERDYLYAGETPPGDDQHAYTVKDLCNHFLTRKDARRKAGEITDRSWQDLRKTCERMAEIVGKARRLDALKVADFDRLREKLAETMGPNTLTNELTRCRMCLKFACPRLIEKQLPYEEALKKPRKELIRKAKRENGERMFEADEIHRILDAATVQMRAMVMLAINTGCGNSDLGQLAFTDLDLEAGWLDYPRPKTQVDRRAKLWPESVAAIKAWLAVRPNPIKDDCQKLVFLTRLRESWHKDSTANPLACEFRKLLAKLGIKRKGLAFYGLRHSFRTVADATLDRSAIDLTMGHCDGSMGARYRERIDDSRLERVAEHVHAWLFGAKS